VATPASSAVAARRARSGRLLHRLSTVLIVAGLLVLGYAAAVYFWKDPVTGLYATYRQHELAGSFRHELEQFAPRRAEATVAAAPSGPAPAVRLRRAAHRFTASLDDGQAFGRLRIAHMGLDVVSVQGTSWAGDLSQGPGHYPQTPVPGLGSSVAIAGHRTTFGAPFRHIDELERGDLITLQMPYATLRYRVQGHRIVASDDWSIIRPQGYERLVLSACHPLYSASQRWIVFARATSATLRDGTVVRLS
jgi:sortase A